MEGVAFNPNLPLYNIIPNSEPLKYAITLKLSPELLEYLTQDPNGRLSVCFGPKQKIMFNGQSFGLQVTEENRQKPHYCLQESPHTLSISKVGMIKQKFLAKQEALRDADIAKYTDSNKKIEMEKESRKIIQIETNLSNKSEGRGKKRKAPSAAVSTTRKQIPPSAAKRNRTSSVATAIPTATTTAAITAPAAAPPPLTTATTTATTATTASAPVKKQKQPSSTKSKASTASMPKFNKSVVPVESHPTPAPKPKLALQPHLIQLLALENLTIDQIAEKRGSEGTKIISNILSKIAARKGAQYHLKPKFYKEVDLNWEGYTQEERLRVEDNVSNAASLELEAASLASTIKKEEKDTNAKKAAHKPDESKSKTRKEALVQIDFEEESLKMDISSSDDNRSSDSEDDVSVGKTSTEQSTVEQPDETQVTNGKERQVNDMNDYKKWKAKWDTQYPLYQDLCKELEENRKLFEKLGEEMRTAEAHEDKLRVITLIEQHYNERNEEMQKKNRKYKKLHAKLKSIKAGLLAFENRSHGANSN